VKNLEAPAADGVRAPRAPSCNADLNLKKSLISLHNPRYFSYHVGLGGYEKQENKTQQTQSLGDYCINIHKKLAYMQLSKQ
jgi:hypothetical protein